MIAFRINEWRKAVDFKAVAIVQVCVNRSKRFCVAQKRIPALTVSIDQLLSLSEDMRVHPLSVSFSKN